MVHTLLFKTGLWIKQKSKYKYFCCGSGRGQDSFSDERIWTIVRWSFKSLHSLPCGGRVFKFQNIKIFDAFRLRCKNLHFTFCATSVASTFELIWPHIFCSRRHVSNFVTSSWNQMRWNRQRALIRFSNRLESGLESLKSNPESLKSNAVKQTEP